MINNIAKLLSQEYSPHTENKGICWNKSREKTVADDLKCVLKNQADWEEKFKGQPDRPILVSPATYKVLMD